MTQDEIIDMWHAANGVKIKGAEYDAVATFAQLVARHEREACAIVCDDINAKYEWPDDVAERVASQWCADAIRARGQA